jgi:uncharacterized membrane protein
VPAGKPFAVRLPPERLTTCSRERNEALFTWGLGEFGSRDRHWRPLVLLQRAIADARDAASEESGTKHYYSTFHRRPIARAYDRLDDIPTRAEVGKIGTNSANRSRRGSGRPSLRFADDADRAESTPAAAPRFSLGDLKVKALTRMFLSGLAAVLPIGVTLFVLYWLGSTAEALLGQGLRLLIPASLYWPGMGVVAGFVLVFAFGALMRAWLFRKVFRWGERVLQRIPLVKALYGSVRDLMGFFSGSDKKAMHKAVMVALGGTSLRLIGFVTREDFRDLPAGIGGDDTVAVYLPMSYQIGGFTTMVPRSAIQALDMSIEEAMRFAVTAGMSAAKEGS